MKTLKYILFILLIITIGVSVYIAVQPNDFKVTRTRTVAAPSQVIYNHIIDVKKMESWLPWLEKDSETKLDLADSTSNIGAFYTWKSNNHSGSIKTLSTVPFQSINQELQFDKIETAQANWEFNQNNATDTEVSWTVSTDKLSFFEKANALIHGGHEKMIGPDLERGLEKLNGDVITAMEVYSIKVDGIAQHGGGYYIYTTTSSKISDIQTTINKVMPGVKDYAIKNNISMAGSPFITYHKWDEANNAVMFSCCIPTSTQTVTTQSDILTGQFEPFRAIKTTLKGNYSNLREARDAGYNYINQYNMEATETGPMLEVYLTDPSQKPNPANWITEIYIAIN
ncbi:transcription activator effector-binding protein [Bizionia argentinensis JUB59]|uniref:Transcription activator effector-binding protein n=1 Tax=Bizionia argentinensis JUB59 TaxID=1046627 RepID=G2EF17_9FLAO|nr:GyrI-like domain-containing protein [Bizionia argentinensis]EGV42959.1 transcription activator effector-binding protein [Bizionia argentinensis JUB59]